MHLRIFVFYANSFCCAAWAIKFVVIEPNKHRVRLEDVEKPLKEICALNNCRGDNLTVCVRFCADNLVTYFVFLTHQTNIIDSDQGNYMLKDPRKKSFKNCSNCSNQQETEQRNQHAKER